MSGRSGTVARNTLANAAYYGVQMLSTLVVLPVALKAFGRSEYGLYATVSGLVLLLQFLNLGLNLGMLYLVADRAARDEKQFQAIVDNCYVTALIANGVIGVIIVVLGAFGSAALNVPPSQHDLFFHLSLVVGITSFANGVLSVPRGILGGLQRFGLRVALDMVSVVAPLLAAFIVAVTDIGIVTFVAIAQVGLVAGGFLCLLGCRAVVPSLKHRVKVHREEFGALLSFSGYQAINQVADIVFFTTDRLVLQRISGSSAVADYTVVERPNRLADLIVSVPLASLIPTASDAYARNETSFINRTFITGTRLYLALTLPPLAVVVGLMSELLRFWIGSDLERLAPYAQILMVALMVAAPFKVFTHLLAGKGRIKELTLSKAVFAPINLAASILLASHFGLAGVLIPTAFYYVIVYPVLCSWLIHDEEFLLTTFAGAVRPAALAAGATVAATSFVSMHLGGVTLMPFVAIFLAALAASWAFALLVGLDARERTTVATLARRTFRRPRAAGEAAP